jgi:hypothetical protein
MIGPIDKSKVLTNCFEAIMDFIVARFGYDKLCSFWMARVAAMDLREVETHRLKMTVDAMLLDFHDSFSSSEKLMPPCINKFIGVIRSPPQQKCKMIDAAFLKASLYRSVNEAS